MIEQQETASIPGRPAQSLGGFRDIGARKSRPYSALAPSSKNKPIFKKCRPNFISFGCNDLRSERAEKLDTVCHNEIMGYCI